MESIEGGILFLSEGELLLVVFLGRLLIEGTLLTFLFIDIDYFGTVFKLLLLLYITYFLTSRLKVELLLLLFVVFFVFHSHRSIALVWLGYFVILGILVLVYEFLVFLNFFLFLFIYILRGRRKLHIGRLMNGFFIGLFYACSFYCFLIFSLLFFILLLLELFLEILRIFAIWLSFRNYRGNLFFLLILVLNGRSGVAFSYSSLLSFLGITFLFFISIVYTRVILNRLLSKIKRFNLLLLFRIFWGFCLFLFLFYSDCSYRRVLSAEKFYRGLLGICGAIRRNYPSYYCFFRTWYGLKDILLVYTSYRIVSNCYHLRLVLVVWRLGSTSIRRLLILLSDTYLGVIQSNLRRWLSNNLLYYSRRCLRGNYSLRTAIHHLYSISVLNTLRTTIHHLNIGILLSQCSRRSHLNLLRKNCLLLLYGGLNGIGSGMVNCCGLRRWGNAFNHWLFGG